MKAIVQQVTKASVTVGEDTVDSIGRGICVLLEIHEHDTTKEMEYIVRKVLNSRLFEDDNNEKWKKSVKDKEYEVLCVSQFSLQGVLKRNKPDFHLAMSADKSEEFYNMTLDCMRKNYNTEKVKDGRFRGFGDSVHIQNDGLVTIEISSLPPSSNKHLQEKKPAAK